MPYESACTETAMLQRWLALQSAPCCCRRRGTRTRRRRSGLPSEWVQYSTLHWHCCAVQKADTNGDGRLSYQEYWNIIRGKIRSSACTFPPLHTHLRSNNDLSCTDCIAASYCSNISFLSPGRAGSPFANNRIVQTHERCWRQPRKSGK